MTFEDMDNINLDETPPPEESSNRPFLIVAGILGAFTLIALACIAAYALYYVPQQRAQQSTQIAQVNAQNTQVAESIIQTSIAEAFTSTPTVTPTQLPVLPTATVTPVVVLPSATVASSEVAAGAPGAGAPTQDPRTATVAALLTQAAGVQQTSAPSATSTGLPTTGFADEVGLPGMIGLAALLIVVIVFARRLRTSG
jgi:hypothetical protein